MKTWKFRTLLPALILILAAAPLSVGAAPADSPQANGEPSLSFWLSPVAQIADVVLGWVQDSFEVIFERGQEQPLNVSTERIGSVDIANGHPSESDSNDEEQDGDTLQPPEEMLGGFIIPNG